MSWKDKSPDGFRSEVGGLSAEVKASIEPESLTGLIPALRFGLVGRDGNCFHSRG